MKLIEDVADCRSVAIVGLAKNAGKTECLNYILKRLAARGHATALTSIGVDGETSDAVTRTPKPEITVYNNMLFATSELHYRQRRLTSEILDLSNRHTALGRLVTARAVIGGKALISGPADTATMRRLIASLHDLGAETVLIDGALSRLSPASPAVADALVLATGAAVASTIKEVERHTRFVCSLIQLPAVDADLAERLETVGNGVWGIDDSGLPHDLKIPSAFALEKNRDRIFSYGTTLFCSGAVSDYFLEFLKMQKQIAETTLIMRDFTRLFAKPETYVDFRRRGGKLAVMRKNRLLAVCVNPISPKGYRLDSNRLCEALEQTLTVPVYDLMNYGHTLNSIA